MKNIYITLLCLGFALSLQAQTAAKLTYQVVKGAKDTILVYGQSHTTSSVEINSLTTSILYDQDAVFEGYQSTLTAAWGTTGENQQADQAISKTYNGHTFSKAWNYGIAALANTSIQLPPSSDPSRLLFKVWFDVTNGSDFYLEDFVESAEMNELTGGNDVAAVSYQITSPGGQLPVELLNFEANVVDQTVELDWTTAVEVNNAGFEVERSLDAFAFSSIGWVEGAGTNTQGHSYRYIDRNLIPGRTYYYRLRQVDTDGQYTYSNTMEAHLSTGQNLFISNCFPNPAPGYSQVKLATATNCKVEWRLYNGLGHVLQAGRLAIAADASQTFDIPLSGLATGTYIVQFACEGRLETRRLIVL